MRKILEKRVLPVLAALCLLVTMVAVAMSFASAANTRLDNWTGYIKLVVKVGNGATNANPNEKGEYFGLSATELYVGDKMNTDGNWFNYAINYTNDDGQPTSSKVTQNSHWYVDGNWKFQSQLLYGHLNGYGDEDITLDTAGLWECYGRTEAGDRILLVSFTVNPLAEEPSSNPPTSTPTTSTPTTSTDGTTSGDTSSTPAGGVDHGAENPALEFSPRNIIMTPKGGNLDEYAYNPADPSNTVDFSNDTVMIDGVKYAAFFVGDSIQCNGQYWTDVNFTTSLSDTTKIKEAYLKKEGSDYSKMMQVGYGHTDGTSNNPITFTEAGEYYIVSSSHGGMEIARFNVFWPTQDIIDQLIQQSQDGGTFYYQKQKVNLVVNDTTGTFCDYVGTDVMEIHVSDSIYIETLWTNYIFEYRKGGKTYQGTVEDIYLYGVKGEASGYNGYVPGTFGQDDKFVEPETGYGEGFDVNKPENLGKPIVTLEKTGTYAVYGNVKVGSTVTSVYLGSFVVTKTPTEFEPNSKFTNSKGEYDDINDHLYAYQPREIKYYVDTPSSYLGQYLSFSEDCNNVFYVTDKLVNGGYWNNNTFDYTDVYGKVHTGKIYNAKYILVTESGNKEMGWAQAGYGNSNAYSSDPFELTQPGLWMIIGQQIEDDNNGRINNLVMATFTVLPLESDDPRGTGDQFTAVSKALKWNGSFNKDDFRSANPDDANDAGTSYIDANGYLYVQHDPATQSETSATIRTIAPLRLGTLFNVEATYAKNVEVGSTTDDKFSVKIGGDISNSLEFVVEYNNTLGIYQGKLYYQGNVLGVVDFTEDYNSAIGTYNIENKFGKITVYKNDKALAFVSKSSGKEVTTFDISKDYYFNVAYVTIGVSGQGSYIPYLFVKPIDPTVINLDKTISFEKFDTDNFKGSTGNLKEGNLHASGRDTPTITTTAPYNLGNSFSVATGFWRTNGFTNYYGEKYAMAIGDITLKVGNDKAGDSKCVAELYYKDVLLGTVDRGNAGGYSISGRWTVNFENGIISVTCNEAKDGTLTQCKFVSAATGEEVTAFQVDDWNFESTHISLTAAGNYGPDGSCSVATLTMTPGSGAASGVSTGGSSGSASTGDASTSLFIILAVIVAAGTVLVTVRKVAVA